MAFLHIFTGLLHHVHSNKKKQRSPLNYFCYGLECEH